MILGFDYGAERIEFEVIYRKRKTLSIKIEPPGIITVIAPEKSKESVIIDIVKNKGSWIIKKLSEVKEKEYLRREHKFVNDEDFLYLGLEYALQIIVDKAARKPKIWLEEDLLYITINENSPDKIKVSLEEWYRKKALEKILERIKHYETYFNFKPNKVTVKEQKKRWGSCNSKRELFFNWKIVMAPVSVIDYLVVHEMSHMVHLNHSKDYWDFVGKIIPDHKERRAWLKKNGLALSL
jgi:predicted metal-dependent hydrolase